jgi:hypothetical protein
LNEGRAAGFMKQETLESSTNLAPLRNQPDFQTLIIQLRSPAPPGLFSPVDLGRHTISNAFL